MYHIAVFILDTFAKAALMLAATVVGRFLNQHIDFIPYKLIPLPHVDITPDDFRITSWTFTLTALALFGLRNALVCERRLADARFIAGDLVVLIVIDTLAAQILFFTTAINFDPRLIAAIGVASFALLLAAHMAAVTLDAEVRQHALGRYLTVVPRFFAHLVSLGGIAALAFSLTLPPAALMFVKDRDFANQVTKIRMFFQQHGESNYGFVNAFGERRFHQPMMVQFSPHDNDSAFVLERHGRLHRISVKDPSDTELVLDFSAKVGRVEIENGALGFDLHPAFGRPGAADAGAAYIYYTSVIDDSQTNYLSRYDIGMATLEKRNGSERRLMAQQRSPDGFHNGGSVEFGPDGFLYLAVGEASAPAVHQRTDRALYGGIFRIDVDQRGGAVSRAIGKQPGNGVTRDYFIPNDNPLVGVPGALTEYWAWGLRNPFRISFDPETLQIWAGEVGSTVWEEVNRIERAGNYQFPYMEGHEATKEARPSEIGGTERGPVYTYMHTAYDRAVIGGMVYRGEKFPELHGYYIFADNYSGKIMTFPASAERVDAIDLIARAPEYAQRGVSSVTQTPRGDVLFTTLGRGAAASGRVLKLSAADEFVGAGDDRVDIVAVAVSPDEARSLFLENCSRCHGEAGRGDGPDSDAFAVQMPDLQAHEFQDSRTDADLAKVIREGGLAVGLNPAMPPWRQILSAPEIDALVRFLRAWGSEDAAALETH